MIIKVKRKLRHPDAPQRHENHSRPMTRRELIGQGFLTGGAAVLTTGLFSLFANPRAAFAQLAEDLAADAGVLGCGVDRTGTKIPFICFDLAGGANLAGSNVLVGQQAFINVAVNLNMIPTKGMTLPFISYGGSSMLAMGLTLGMALALTRRRPGAYSSGDGLSKAGAFA